MWLTSKNILVWIFVKWNKICLWYGIGCLNINSYAPREKRARLDACDFQVTDEGAQKKSIRTWHRGGEKVAEATPSSTSSSAWQMAANCPIEPRIPEYDEDGYIIWARNWPDGSYNAPHWHDGGISYESRRGGPWKDKAPMQRLNTPRPRYPSDRGHIMDHMYVDIDGYQIEHPIRQNMHREGKHHGYSRTPTRYSDKKSLVGDALSFCRPQLQSLCMHTLWHQRGYCKYWPTTRIGHPHTRQILLRMCIALIFLI